MTRPQKTKTSSESTHIERLYGVLNAAEGRFKLREAAWYVPVSGALGLLATLLLTIIWRLRGEISLVTLLGTCALLVVMALLAASFYALLHPRDTLQTARQADHLLSLDERLATALEAANRTTESFSPAQERMRDAQLKDALTSVSSISMRRKLPVVWKAHRFIPAGLLVLLILVAAFVPDPFLGENRAVQAQITHEQQKIQALEQAVKASPRLAQDPSLQALLKDLSDLSTDLSSGDLKREEAVARLSATEDKLKKSLDANTTSQRAALDELAKQLTASSSATAKEIGAALKSGDPQKASDAVKAAADNAAKMSPQEQKALSDALNQARDNIASLDPETARRLNDASDALSANSAEAAKKALEDLGQHIADTEQKLATQQQVSQALSQLQQSKQNIAQAGEPTPQPANSTAVANSTPPVSNTSAANGTPLPGGTSVAQAPSTSQPSQGTPAVGTSVALGTPIQGQLPRTGTPVSSQPNGTPSPGASGTPVAAQGTASTGGTPVAIDGQGQGQQGGQNGGNPQPGQGPGNASTQGGNGQGSQWGTGHQEPVYAPPRNLSATLTPIVIQGQTNPGGEQGNAPINGGTTMGQAQVPYEQVFGQYQEQAGAALGSSYIPQGYKDLVRDYFSELEPGP